MIEEPDNKLMRVMAALVCFVVVMSANICSAAEPVVMPLATIRVSTPQILSVSFGLGYDLNRLKPSYNPDDLNNDNNLIIGQIEPGIGGVKAQLGFGAREYGCMGYGGWIVKGSLLRTFGNHIGPKRNNTYFGGEIESEFVFFRLSAGVYRNISDRDSDDTLITAGVGLVIF